MAEVYRALSGGTGDAGSLRLPGGYEHSSTGERSSTDHLSEADAAAVCRGWDQGRPAFQQCPGEEPGGSQAGEWGGGDSASVFKDRGWNQGAVAGSDDRRRIGTPPPLIYAKSSKN